MRYERLHPRSRCRRRSSRGSRAACSRCVPVGRAVPSGETHSASRARRRRRSTRRSPRRADRHRGRFLRTKVPRSRAGRQAARAGVARVRRELAGARSVSSARTVSARARRRAARSHPPAAPAAPRPSAVPAPAAPSPSRTPSSSPRTVRNGTDRMDRRSASARLRPRARTRAPGAPRASRSSCSASRRAPRPSPDRSGTARARAASRRASRSTAPPARSTPRPRPDAAHPARPRSTRGSSGPARAPSSSPPRASGSPRRRARRAPRAAAGPCTFPARRRPGTRPTGAPAAARGPGSLPGRGRCKRARRGPSLVLPTTRAAAGNLRSAGSGSPPHYDRASGMAYSLDPKRFVQHVGSWLESKGPEADVVVSCRVRLARNVEGYPFVLRLEDDKARELGTRVRDVLLEQRIDGETIWVGMEEAPPILKLLLRERYLVSRDLAPNDPRLAARPGRGVAFGENERLAVMVNEEDHLRLQSLSAGYSLAEAFARVRDLDQALERELSFAVDPQFGYLTGCPTNVGTGLRASVMLHLPALGLVKSELEKVIVAAQRTGLAVRGMYGEGSRAAGDFYQVSNQITLGRSEEQLLEDLKALVPAIVRFERDLRTLLANERKAALQDRIQRSQGLLRTARALQTDQALAHLSTLRLGLELDLLTEPKLALLNQLGVQVQKGHVQALAQGEQTATSLVEASERDRMRASLLRTRLGARGA